VSEYKCWHGEADEPAGEIETVEAACARDAAMRFAIRHDEGEDYDIVFVAEGGRVYEYRCRYERSVTCNPQMVKDHTIWDAIE
jgi:hypothetical protein